jgi:dsRNA-specific ribonuclease
MDLIREALTSPSAFRNYDYERLEFYGDSIAGFLVILELFLSNPTFVEGDLDHERINRVQNSKFFLVNKEQKFYHYMITDSHHVFSGFVPAGFNGLRYQEEIIYKSFNEQYNSFQELKAVKNRLT